MPTLMRYMQMVSRPQFIVQVSMRMGKKMSKTLLALLSQRIW
jgi:hypothetical protein